MGLRHPKRRFRDGAVLDYEDVGAVTVPIAEELVSRLDEHNFSKGMRAQLNADRSRLEADYAWRAAHFGYGHLDNLMPRRHPDVAGWAVADDLPLKYPLDWQVVAEVQVFSQEGGMARVVAGAQYYTSKRAVASPTVTSGRSWTSYWGIRVNGAVNGENVNGDQDDGDLSLFGERAYGGWAGAAKLDTLVSLPPGVSVIQLVTRTANKGSLVVGGDENKEAYEVITNREIFVLELGR